MTFSDGQTIIREAQSQRRILWFEYRQKLCEIILQLLLDNDCDNFSLTSELSKNEYRALSRVRSHVSQLDSMGTYTAPLSRLYIEFWSDSVRKGCAWSALFTWRLASLEREGNFPAPEY
jgi:hypothetical protein